MTRFNSDHAGSTYDKKQVQRTGTVYYVENDLRITFGTLYSILLTAANSMGLSVMKSLSFLLTPVTQLKANEMNCN